MVESSRKLCRFLNALGKSDIEIAREATLKPISEIADRLGILSSALTPYGHDKGKITAEFIKFLIDKRDGKLILVN